MKLDVVCGNSNDEYYTPSYAVKPILKYIKPNSTVWCPFDLENESKFIQHIKEQGHNTLATHINTGQDFFKYLPEKMDYIISNPPYSVKSEIFRRLFDLKVPFAMLVGEVGLFESKKRFGMFRDNHFEILRFNKRIKFFKSYGEKNPSLNPPFSSIYVTMGMLPDRIVFEELVA